jgi:hypothetical protein
MRRLRLGRAICEASAVTGSPGDRQRSSASIVMTRSDPHRDAGQEAIPAPAPARDWQWVWWVPLGLIVAGIWALLLFGDSLQPPPG